MCCALLCSAAMCSMGFSQWGASATKSACTHKSTKMALTQLNKSLADDLAEAGMTYIGVHNLSPGALNNSCVGLWGQHDIDDIMN
jgi:NAD(P)-dependent dehydrogenase (short-subunit alcohol dehydrogenase family)